MSWQDEDDRFYTPTIEKGVPGPRRESGLLLRTPRSEQLVWDLEMEVVPASRSWDPAKRGWWIAASYLETVVAIVLRTFPSVMVLGEDEDRMLSRDGHEALQTRLL